MPRTTVFSPEELAELSVELRRVRELDEYCRDVHALIEKIYRVSFVYCYHFYDGHIHFPTHPVSSPTFLADLLALFRKTKFYRPKEWHAAEPKWTHSAVYADQYPQKDMEELLAFFQGAEFMIGGWVFEGDFFLGTAGAARALADGDFTQAELTNFAMLLPHWQAGMLECARYTRAKLLGSDFAALVENHPSGLFLFNGAKLVYANQNAKLLLQDEPREGTEGAIAQLSAIPGALITGRSEGTALLPFGKKAHIRSLPVWPELNLKEPWLAVVPEAPVELPLSEREAAILRAYAGNDSADAAAKASGVAVSTYRTHLSNIAGKLGVSGSNAALTLWYLSGSDE